jgi:hypothetical protein
MREVINRTLAVHPGNAVWYGESRIGKTTTAQHLVKLITEAYDSSNPYAFRAIHYEAGAISNWSGNEQKRGLRSLYNSTIGRIDEGLYNNDPNETIASNIVQGLMRKNIQLVCIDEAGNLTLDAIRGILMTYDAAKNLGYNLSFVFIGMDDLPVKVTNLPQVEGRMHEWCYFQPYSVKEIADALGKLCPSFADIDLNKPNDSEIVNCIYELCGGYLGLIVPFLQRVEKYQLIKPEEINSKYLRTIFLRTQIDKNTSINKSIEIFGEKRLENRLRKSLKNKEVKMNSKKKNISSNKRQKRNYHRSGRWLEEPKEEHKRNYSGNWFDF